LGRVAVKVWCLGRRGRALVLSPEILEATRGQLSVSHRVLDVAVAEVGLQRSRIVALVGQRQATSLAQHVRMSRKAQLGLDPSALYHARKACLRERRPPLAGERERRLGILLPLQLAHCPHFIAENRMGGRRTLLGPADVKDGVGEILKSSARDAARPHQARLLAMN
jgi:hypothetical protein